MYRQGDLVGELQDRIRLGIQEWGDVVRVSDLETAHAAAFDHALHFFHGGLDGSVGDAGEARVAVRVRIAEIGEPLVVDADQLDRGLSVIQPPGSAEDPVEYLG